MMGWLERWEAEVNPLVIPDLGPCCERCGCPVDPAFADRTDEGWLCMDCFELEQQERREAW